MRIQFTYHHAKIRCCSIYIEWTLVVHCQIWLSFPNIEYVRTLPFGWQGFSQSESSLLPTFFLIRPHPLLFSVPSSFLYGDYSLPSCTNYGVLVLFSLLACYILLPAVFKVRKEFFSKLVASCGYGLE